MKLAFYTNKGCVRKANEDALFIGGRAIYDENMTAPSIIEINGDREIFCVVDGMGGYIGGATAARITAQSFAAALESDNKIWLESVIQNASEQMNDEASRSPGLSQMGAALAGAIIDRSKKSIFAFNLGDCRVYRFQGGFLDKLTHDHSHVQELFDRGEITEEEMRTHPKKNIVTAGIIVNEPSILEFFCRELPFKDSGKYFSCSDGVWEALPIEDIEESLSKNDMDAACTDLVNKLFSAECSDNVSFVFVEI
jgi:protein phosphatase